MSTLRVNCTIHNIVNSENTVKIEEVLVDIASSWTWLPEDMLKTVGVEREKDIEFTSANGQSITRTVGYVIIHCDQFQTVDEVVFAEPGDMSLLGVRMLNGFNAAVDSNKKKLVAAGPILAA